MSKVFGGCLVLLLLYGMAVVGVLTLGIVHALMRL